MEITKKFIGVDVGKDNLSIAWSEGKGYGETTIKNELEAIEAWLKGSSGPDANSHVVLESTGTYSCKLVYMLSEANIPFSVINPIQSSGYAKVEMTITKNDKSDAKMLVRFGEKNTPPLHVPRTKEQEDLRENQNLLEYYQFCRRKLENMIHSIKQKPSCNQAVLTKMIADVADYKAKEEEIEKELQQSVLEHYEEQTRLAMSVPGIGPKTSTLLILNTAGFVHFDNIKSVLKYIGLAVVERESGKTRKRGIICRTGLPTLRACLYMCARAARKSNRACRELYDRLRKANKPHKVAMIAVCQKLVKQVFAIIKSGVSYQDDFHTQFQTAK